MCVPDFQWGYLEEKTGYTTQLDSILLGVVFAAYVGLAAWVSGVAGRRRLASAGAVLWGLIFGGWFSFATLRLTDGLFDAAPILDDLGGGTLWQRMTGMALGIAGAGVATAFVLWWMTGSRCVLLWSLVVGLATALLAYGGQYSGYVWNAEIVLWHAGTAAVLGRWIVKDAEAQRTGTVCVTCGYSLVGLVGPRCPECGGAIARPQSAGGALPVV